jgi:hypothetical protein
MVLYWGSGLTRLDASGSGSFELSVSKQHDGRVVPFDTLVRNRSILLRDDTQLSKRRYHDVPWYRNRQYTEGLML